MSKISAALVIYNEEKRIRKCIDNLKDVVDEFVFVHDGECTDNTLNILQEYQERENLKIKVLVADHLGVPDPHRALSFAETSHEWILPIDPDTYLQDDLKRDLPQLIADEDVDLYQVRRTFWDGHTHSLEPEEYIPILVRKSKMFYVGIPHSMTGTITRGRVKKIGHVVLHEHRQDQEISLRLAIHKFRYKYIPWAKVHAAYLVMPFEQVPKFQATYTDWDTAKRRRILAHPYWMALSYFGFNLCKNLVARRMYRLGQHGWLSAFGLAYYSFLVYFWVGRIKSGFPGPK